MVCCVRLLNTITLILAGVKSLRDFLLVCQKSTELQLIAFRIAGCEHIYDERASGRNVDRPVLKQLISELQRGGELVVWRLDRLGRSMRHRVVLVEELRALRSHFREGALLVVDASLQPVMARC